MEERIFFDKHEVKKKDRVIITLFMCFLCILFCRPFILLMIAVMVARMGVWEFDDGMIVFKSLYNLIHAGECPLPQDQSAECFQSVESDE